MSTRWGERVTRLPRCASFELIDDAFYGRPLIAVTGVKGAGKTSLAKRFVQQFANEAECIPIALSDFDNRDDFIKRLVTKLSPDSIEYVADFSPSYRS